MVLSRNEVFVLIREMKVLHRVHVEHQQFFRMFQRSIVPPSRSAIDCVPRPLIYPIFYSMGKTPEKQISEIRSQRAASRQG